jgi:hypothetical protein
MVETEPITLYFPRGYHPIDILGPFSETESRQYRIMQKLGWGAFSTVWLAQMTDSSQAFVSVKVTTADDDIDLTKEATMLAKGVRVGPSRVDDVGMMVELAAVYF